MMKIKTLVMSSPEYFDVAYAINPHMLDKDGNLNKINQPLARKQWLNLKNLFTQTGLAPEVLPASAHLLDFVFCANTFFAWEDNGIKKAILSNMHSAKRQPEVAIGHAWLKQQGFEIQSLPATIKFEAMGDLIWNLQNNSLYMGYGFRTSLDALKPLQSLVPFTITPLQLVDERFYHLDTCFFTLDKNTVAFVKEAFSAAALARIQKDFKNCIKISVKEAIDSFAGNAFCPDGKNVFVHPGAQTLKKRLVELSFVVHETDTSEFIKSGGSVFCLKNFIPCQK